MGGRLMMAMGVAAALLPALAEPPVFESKTVGFVIREAATEDATKTVRELVAVPFAGMDGAAIKVADVLASTELAEGDSLYAFDKANDRYNAWRYSGTAWVPAKTLVKDAKGQFTAEGPDTEQTEIAAGAAVWLERKDATQPVVLVGRKAEPSASEVGAGWNLCGNPGIEGIDLNERFPAPGAKDRVIVPSAGNLPRIYTLADASWGYAAVAQEDGVNVPVRKAEDADRTIPAGSGFWYVKEGE